MSDKSSIEWTDATWNPFRGTKGRHHCVRISEGCKNCYAAAMNQRFNGPDYVKGADTPRLDEEALLQPLKWKRPRRIFVCSMTDLFMDEHSDGMIDRVFAVMALAPHHTFQVLTKRAKRMREYMLNDDRFKVGARAFEILAKLARKGTSTRPWPLPNVWLGVSAENQERADERIPDLLATPAAVRFVSAEPLLGPVSFRWAAWHDYQSQEIERRRQRAMVLSNEYDGLRGKLDWVIIGGESGPGARPCDVAWVRSIKDECADANVACFVKQLGANPITGRDHGHGCSGVHLKDKKGGDPSEWPTSIRVRQMPGELTEEGKK